MKTQAANPPRQRADILLVERGLFESRAKAQAAIAAGLVTADAVPVRKASYAVDVGTAQLHPHLRGEPKIVSLEHTDIRALDPNRLGEPPDFITIDVSFISLKSVLPAAFAVAGRPAH